MVAKKSLVHPATTIIMLLFLLIVKAPLHAEQTTPENSVNDGTQAMGDQTKTTLIELYSWATILPKQLIDLQNELGKDKAYKRVEDELPNVKRDVEDLRWDTTMAQTNPEIQPIEVASYESRVSRLTQRLTLLGDPITSTISALTTKRKQWQDKKQQLDTFNDREELKLTITPSELNNLKSTIKEAVGLIEERLKQTLILGKQIGDLQVVVYTIDNNLQSLSADLREISIQQTSPSMLSYAFYEQLQWSVIKRSLKDTETFISNQFDLISKSGSYVFLILLGLAALSYGLKKTEKLVSDTSRWRSFARCPGATSLFIAVSVYTTMNLLPLQNSNLSQSWESMFHFLLLLAIIRLIPYLVEVKWKRQALKVLTFFMLLTIFFIVLGVPRILIHIYVFYVSFAALIIYVIRLRKSKDKIGLQLWIARLWGLFPAIIVLSGIGGYDQFAVLIFSTVLSTCMACLIIWVLYQFHLAVLILLFKIAPIPIIRENRKQIVDSLRPVIAWLHIFLLVTAEAVIWDLYPSFNEAISGITQIGFDIGGLHISPGFIFVVILVFYGALIISQATQALLLRNVLPRYAAEKGVQLSITRLVHYAILTIGFLVMLNLLGFELKQLTILGGALGVGIGFGLQAIVNNFASGLILLFERPIKIGDTIQIGSDLGEVKNLGLRATIIQTFDNAEIVVPNSDLVTGQVTNWTLAERKVRLRIPVGVAYGTDIQKVLDILISCANANPMILSTPKPAAFFLAFGASSLDFELRVWIPEFLDGVQVRSDLNLEIESEFAAQSIEIPFPQQDLHVRSIDEHLITTFTSTKNNKLQQPTPQD